MKPITAKEIRLLFRKTSHQCQNYNILYGYSSDHSLIVLDSEFATEENYRNYWEFNSALLKQIKDHTFVHKISKISKTIKAVKDQYLVTPYNGDFFYIYLNQKLTINNLVQIIS